MTTRPIATKNKINIHFKIFFKKVKHKETNHRI